ncbi:hypothetical protein ISS30_10410 [bacterium]|nr:hypothetical protein [FCB group bacterium]MBL7192095.1 hypothetical protein [bacterium]
MLRLRQLQRTEPLRPKTAAVPQTSQPGAPNFADVLQDMLSTPDIIFSAHAVSRLIDRNITLNQEQIDRIRGGVGKAEAKGANDSLVLLNDLAFVVSIKNHTVITAMSGPGLKDNVFTNIDSAVIV